MIPSTIHAKELDKNIIKSTSIYENYEYTLVYNTDDESFKSFKRNILTNELESSPIYYVNDNIIEEDTISIEPLANKIHQDTFLNFECDIWEGNPREWNLERPQSNIVSQYYFKVYENKSNTNELKNWKNRVDELNDQEFVVIQGIGMTALATAKTAIEATGFFATGLLTPADIQNVLNVVMELYNTVHGVKDLLVDFNLCSEAYFEVKDATDNIHFD